MKNQESCARRRSARRTPYTPRYLRPQTPKEKRRSLILRRTVLSILLLLCFVSALGLGVFCCMLLHNNRQLEELADIVSKNNVVIEYEPTASATDPSFPTDSESATVPTAPTEPTILPQYAPLHTIPMLMQPLVTNLSHWSPVITTPKTVGLW